MKPDRRAELREQILDGSVLAWYVCRKLLWLLDRADQADTLEAEVKRLRGRAVMVHGLPEATAAQAARYEVRRWALRGLHG